MDSIIYLYEEMGSHLYKVVNESGEVLDNVDILSAEGYYTRLRKRGITVIWIDKIPSRERKHVRQIMADCRNGPGMLCVQS